MSGQGLRVNEWGDVRVVVLRGEVDLDSAAHLSRTLGKLQREATVFVDLWDVTHMDPIVVGVLAAAKLRAEVTRWDFALVAPKGGLADREIEEAGLADALRPYVTKHDARAAMRG